MLKSMLSEGRFGLQLSEALKIWYSPSVVLTRRCPGNFVGMPWPGFSPCSVELTWAPPPCPIPGISMMTFLPMRRAEVLGTAAAAVSCLLRAPSVA